MSNSTKSTKKNKTKADVKRHKKTKKEINKDKKELTKFLRRLYYFLKHHSDKIDYKKLHGNTDAYYETDTGEITIDYRRNIIASLIHESLHHFHPDWSETRVLKNESKIMNLLTARQLKNIIRKIAENF